MQLAGQVSDEGDRNAPRADARGQRRMLGVKSAKGQGDQIIGIQARDNLGAGDSDLTDRDLAVTQLPARQIENSNPVPGTVAAKCTQGHDNERGVD